MFTVMTDAASAGDKRRPVTGGGKEGSAQKTPDRPSKDRPVNPDPGRKERPGEIGGRRDTSPGGTYRRPPRDITKIPDGTDGKRKEKGPTGWEKRKDFRRPPVQPVIGGGGGCIRPPGHRPHPPVIRYDYTYIYNDYRYIYQPIIIGDLIDDDLYGIDLPFGPIIPWEIGEFYLIRLKNLEREGLGGTMITTIVQTTDEMSWERFLARFQDDITDIVYYGPVGRTSFLAAMTVSDILDLMVSDGIRWVGEFFPEYKIVPGGRNSRFYVLSLEGDTTGFRRELRDAGVFVMGFDHETQEYFVRSSQDTYDSVSKLWWVARISGVPGVPFFQPEYEYLDVGMAP